MNIAKKFSISSVTLLMLASAGLTTGLTNIYASHVKPARTSRRLRRGKRIAPSYVKKANRFTNDLLHQSPLEAYNTKDRATAFGMGSSDSNTGDNNNSNHGRINIRLIHNKSYRLGWIMNTADRIVGDDGNGSYGDINTKALNIAKSIYNGAVTRNRMHEHKPFIARTDYRVSFYNSKSLSHHYARPFKMPSKETLYKAIPHYEKLDENDNSSKAIGAFHDGAFDGDYNQNGSATFNVKESSNRYYHLGWILVNAEASLVKYDGDGSDGLSLKKIPYSAYVRANHIYNLLLAHQNYRNFHKVSFTHFLSVKFTANKPMPLTKANAKKHPDKYAFQYSKNLVQKYLTMPKARKANFVLGMNDEGKDPETNRLHMNRVHNKDYKLGWIAANIIDSKSANTSESYKDANVEYETTVHNKGYETES